MWYLVYNGFWNPQGAPPSAAALCEAARAQGIPLAATPHTRWVATYDHGVTIAGLQAGDTVIFWDKDTRLAHAMEQAGARLFNPARAIELCDDKSKTHEVLAAAGLPCPRTLLAPMAYVAPDAAGCEEFWRQAEELGFPLVVKECFGSLGGQVYLAHDRQELQTLSLSMGAKPYLAQEFIAACAGNDKRLYVVGDRVVAAMRRHSDTDFRANIENGGVGFPYTPTEREIALSLAAARALGLDFAGVDLLDGKAGTLICEVNSNAHMAGLSGCTGVDVAGEIIRYTAKKTGVE